MQAKMEDVGRPLSSPPMISNYSLYKLIKCPQDLKLRIHKFFLSMKSCTLLIVQVVYIVHMFWWHQNTSSLVRHPPRLGDSYETVSWFSFTEFNHTEDQKSMVFFLVASAQCFLLENAIFFRCLERQCTDSQLMIHTQYYRQVGATSQFEAHDRKILITISKPQRSSCIFDLRSQFVYILLQSLKLQVRHLI